jgi:hypothetical protein
VIQLFLCVSFFSCFELSTVEIIAVGIWISTISVTVVIVADLCKRYCIILCFGELINLFLQGFVLILFILLLIPRFYHDT